MNQLKCSKSDIILNTLSPLEPKVQRYMSLAKEIKRLLDAAEGENEPCVSVELAAEFFMLQEELYQECVTKRKMEAN